MAIKSAELKAMCNDCIYHEYSVLFNNYSCKLGGCESMDTFCTNEQLPEYMIYIDDVEEA